MLVSSWARRSKTLLTPYPKRRKLKCEQKANFSGVFQARSYSRINGMKSHFNLPMVSPSGAALLTAAGVPSSMDAARSAVDVIKTCLRAAARKWPDAPIGAWVSAAGHLESRLREAAVSDDAMAVRLSRDPSDNFILLHAILKWEPPFSQAGIDFDLTALLGRAFAVRAEHGTTLPVDLINGALTLRRASQAKGRRARDWELLLGVALCSTEDLHRFRQSLAPNSPCLSLVTQLIEVTSKSINGPLPTQARQPEGIDFTERHAEIDSTESEPSVLPAANDLHGDSNNLSASQSFSMDDDEDQSHIPDIKRRIAAADYSNFAEKLGIYHRDQLLPEDLRIVTRRLVQLLDASDRVRSGYALLALISLITGCTDKVALNLRFAPKDTIWLDLDRQAWAWNFGAYRGHDGLPETEFEAVYCPLPSLVIQRLSALQALATSPVETLGELIVASQHRTRFDLDDFRNFLRACGDTAHPAHRGRFARSLTTVVLERTGSDMTAALCTGRFHATAPAALYYYGPTTALIEDRMGAVYQWLGLGDSARSACGSFRQGCIKVLDDHQCTAGWQSLVAAIDQARIDTLAAPSNETWLHANAWMSLLAFGFVVQTAHRGIRLDRLTFGALFTSPCMGTIHDKDDALGARAQPRLIPWTTTVQGLLSAALECHEIVNKSGEKSAVDADNPVFVQWATNEGTTAIRTSHLTPIAAKYFGRDVNFGRSQWVTSLDRDGADRWLIRTLTGHARDLTRTSGAYLDVPPVVAADRLRAAMESTGRKVFGSRQVFATSAAWKPAGLSPDKTDLLPAQPGSKVPDPRTVLLPISVRSLMGWSMAHKMRSSLAQGKINASAPALALLHLLFIDLVTDPDCALDAVLSTESSRISQRLGLRQGLLWKRPHLVGATWLPIQPSTWLLLEKARPASLNRTTLIRDVCSAAEEALSCANWPESAADRWATVTACAQNFRRLSLPPSLAAISAIEVPAPALSLYSLARLAGQSLDRQLSSTHTPRNTQQRQSARDESLDFLSKALNKYSNQQQKLGERRKRAIDCRREITEATVRWTPFARFLRDWLTDELIRTRDQAQGCYQLSSLATYFSTITIARSKVPAHGDPDEWTEDEWIAFLDWTEQFSGSSQSEDRTALGERVRHAVMALVRSLRRRQMFVPTGVYERLREQIPPTAGSSSSAVLVTHGDMTHAAQIAQAWLSESPVDALLLQMRAVISHEFPSRAGDLSSLAWDCLTENNGLVIRRQGYNVHKTNNAIRVHRLSTDCARAVRVLREQLSQYTSARDLLLRLDGSNAAGLRDSQLAELWSIALKEATGDRKARPHSARAAALQEIAWPDWQAQAAKWMSTTTGSQHIGRWIDHLQTNWTRVAQAAVTAGHGDLRSALGNYLAAWPLVYGMTVEALLRPLHIGAGFLRQLDIDPAALRKARSRHTIGNTSREDQDFDPWAWLQAHLIRNTACNTSHLREVREDPPRGNFEPKAVQMPIAERDESLADSALYLTVRTLSLSQPAAIEATRTPLSTAIELEPLVPDSDTATELTRRARTSVQGRGQEGNIQLALSAKGREIIQWLVGLDPSDFAFFHLCAMRADASAAAFAEYQHWLPITETIPRGLSLTVRLGSAYASPGDVLFFAGLQEKLRLVIDPGIGCKPRISLCPVDRENRVHTARLTSVLKAGLFSIHQLHQSKT